MELMAADDEGEITVTVDTRPGLQSEKVDEILKQVEAIISQDENLDSYMTSYGSSRRRQFCYCDRLSEGRPYHGNCRCGSKMAAGAF